MHHSPDETTSSVGAASLSAEDLRVRLRPLISAWAQANPERIFYRVPIGVLVAKSDGNALSAFTAFRDLEGYVGAAEPDATRPAPIPWPYELYPGLEAVEVLMVSDELVADPVRRLAEEVAYLVHASSASIPTDEVFSFRIPSAIAERRSQMSTGQKTVFRLYLNDKLFELGFTIQGGSVNSILEIRRNR